MPIFPSLVGTDQNDVLDATKDNDTTVGLAGDDTIAGGAGADRLFGDFVSENLLGGTETATSFAQYEAAGGLQVSHDAAGNTQMSQDVTTAVGATYEIRFETAANYGAGVVSGRVEVLWNDVSVGIVDTNSAIFAQSVMQFSGTGEVGVLTFRALEAQETAGPVIDTSGPIYWYEKTIERGGEELTVKAFAEGQSSIYQVMNGKLHTFDPVTETYTAAGANATVTVNCIGFNAEDDLIYGIAVSNGVDALGQSVSNADLVMYDATGAVFRVGETPYRSWTGDFDAAGNLWAFHSSMDRLTMIDVDQTGADGNPLSTTFKFPKEMITDQLWDVAFDAATQSFYGLVRANKEGAATKLYQIDVSDVQSGGEPTFSTVPVVQTVIDGAVQSGAPAITFGAFMIDGDGNFYAGGNGGDHDMDNATAQSGGIYRIDRSVDGSQAQLVLVAGAPKSYSNDGAVDPRAMDPFTQPDAAALVLIRGPELTEVPEASGSYDDQIDAGGDADFVDGGFGDDTVIGASRGDELHGGLGNDAIYGGSGPDSQTDWVSSYDANGLRYDPFGNLLPEDDDLIFGGDGDDALFGAAGHDRMEGGAGNDTLNGGTGHDVLLGGLGADILNGGRENDTLRGGADDDVLSGGTGDDALHGDAGNDRLVAGKGDDVVTGGAGDDVLLGGTGNDDLTGGEGADTLKGGSHDDRLGGGGGEDLLEGGSGDDALYGDAGADRLNGGSGNDSLFGGAGRDYLTGGKGADSLDGGAGKDTLALGAGDDIAAGGAGDDRFVFRFADLGDVDTITDYRRSNGEADRVDLRQLGLIDDAAQAGDWVAEHLSAGAQGGAVVQLGAGAIVLLDAYGIGEDFLDHVADGLQLI